MIYRFKIEFDRNYGSDNKTGWSIIEESSYYAMLEKHLIVAIIKWLMKRNKK